MIFSEKNPCQLEQVVLAAVVLNIHRRILLRRVQQFGLSWRGFGDERHIEPFDLVGGPGSDTSRKPF